MTSTKKPKTPSLKKYLESLSREQLIDLVADLKDKFANVKEYLVAVLNPENQDKLFEKYRKKVQDVFFPTRGYGKLKFNEAIRAIAEFQKVCKSPQMVIDLRMCFVENGIEFFEKYGGISDSFYSVGRNMFRKALEEMKEHNLSEIFIDDCNDLIEAAKDVGNLFQVCLEEDLEALLKQQSPIVKLRKKPQGSD